MQMSAKDMPQSIPDLCSSKYFLLPKWDDGSHYRIATVQELTALKDTGFQNDYLKCFEDFYKNIYIHILFFIDI